MNNQNYTTSFTVDQTPEEVFKAITNPRAWWSEGITGNTEEEGDEFVFEVEGIHRSTQKLVDVVPGKHVGWEVIKSDLHFPDLKDNEEWTGTKVTFDIEPEGDKTKVTFTHEGLTPETGSYKYCTPGWDQYVGKSLPQYIATGEGDPDRIKEVPTPE